MNNKIISFDEHLVDFLSNPEASAIYLAEILEDNEGNPELLKLGIKDVFYALTKDILLETEMEKQLQTIDNLMNEERINLIYCLVNWLNLCGLKLSVEVSNDSEKIEKISNSIIEENNLLTEEIQCYKKAVEDDFEAAQSSQ